MEVDAPADEVDALAARIEEIDELGAGDDATYGNDQWGLGAVLKMLIKNADVEAVREHLALIDYHDEAVSAHHLGLAARLQYFVQYEDVNRHKAAREVLLLLVAASDEQTLGQRVVDDIFWAPAYTPGRSGPDFPPWVYDPDVSFDAVTVLHQFAWDGDVDAVAMFLALPQCTTRLVNATAGQRISWDGSVPLPGSTQTMWEPREPLTDEVHEGSTALHVACVAGRASIVRLLLRDGRADPNHPDTGRMSPLAAAVGSSYIFHGRQNHLVAECIRELTLDPRTVVDFWYTKLAGDYPGAGARSHVLHRLAKYGFLEATYHVLAALPKLDPDSVKQDSPGGISAATPILSPIEQCAIGPPCGTVSDTHHPLLCFLIEVSNAGSFRRWRAEKAREFMVTRALVARARGRGEFCATASLAHGLFNLRDDAIFLRVLGYCWFLNPRKRRPSLYDYTASGLRKAGKSRAEVAEIIWKMPRKYHPVIRSREPGVETDQDSEPEDGMEA